ncbi:helix-hairpin-helix domain-containing protein [Natronorubrum sulfidifaciens]|uniref:helix-hairpin-helix domain-containing protein n=1 Tax=Natronorubrum sulfidifaciens TaxID=388259 RepID=UPI0013759B48|nr:helix-hairpin-helix domain-containing protein [Natronorubrum sulfidifaciens]
MAWWSHRFSITDTSFEERSESVEESLSEFWDGIPEKYEGPSEGVGTTEKTELASVGEPPEKFSRAFEVVEQYHNAIRESQNCEVQFSRDTPIKSIVKEIPRAGQIIVANLKKEGYETFGDLEGATRDELTDVNRVGRETAERLLEFIHDRKTEGRGGSRSRDASDIADNVDLREISDSISGFGDVSRKKIQKSGYETVGDVRTAPTDELTDIEQIGEGTISKLTDYIADHTETPSSTVDSSLSDDTTIEDFVTDVPRVGRVLVSKLNQAGYETVGDLRSATVNDLTTVEHIGQKKAELLLKSTRLK